MYTHRAIRAPQRRWQLRHRASTTTSWQVIVVSDAIRGPPGFPTIVHDTEYRSQRRDTRGRRMRAHPIAHRLGHAHGLMGDCTKHVTERDGSPLAGDLLPRIDFDAQ